MKYPEAYKSMRTDAPALSFPAVMPIYSTDDGNLTQTRALMQHLYETGGVTQFAICFPLNRPFRQTQKAGSPPRVENRYPHAADHRNEYHMEQKPQP